MVLLDLSIDLIFIILRYLPFYQIYRLRSVCKAWNTLLCSPAFLQAWSGAPHADWVVMMRMLPDPCLQRPRELVAFDPATDRWMSLQHLLDSCPPTAFSALGGPFANASLSRKGRGLPSLSPLMEASSTTSAAGNLVCFWKFHAFEPSIRPTYKMPASVDSLLVLNLLNGSHRILPPPHQQMETFGHYSRAKWSDQQVSMQLLPHNAFRVFFYSGLCWPLQIYDSCKGLWESRKPRRGPFPEKKIESSADMDDADFVLLTQEMHFLSAYNVKLDKWKHVAFGRFTTSPFDLTTVVLHEGRVFVAAVQDVQTSYRGFAVWELQFLPHAEWIEVARTPLQFWREFNHISCNPVGTSMTSAEGAGTMATEVCMRLDGADSTTMNSQRTWRIMSSGPLICLTSANDAIMKGDCNHIPPLVYNLVLDSWFQLPCYKGDDNFTAAFSVRPSFVALT